MQASQSADAVGGWLYFATRAAQVAPALKMVKQLPISERVMASVNKRLEACTHEGEPVKVRLVR